MSLFAGADVEAFPLLNFHGTSQTQYSFFLIGPPG